MTEIAPTFLASLESTTAPWVILSTETEQDKKWQPSLIFGGGNLTPLVRVLRGRKMRTVQSLMDEFSAAFQFFDEFGENWYALNECLCCLDEWMPSQSYVVVIRDAAEVLIEEDLDELKWLLLTIQEVGQSWATPVVDNDRFNRGAIPFHAVFKCPKKQIDLVKLRFSEAASEVDLLFEV